LNVRTAEEAPARGFAPPLHQSVAFRALPISEATLRGLEDAKTPFTVMTAIQNACIPHALAGRDILGAAKTGRCVNK
jgi:ATP-dependent RNA helicase DDX10/DBP4